MSKRKMIYNVIVSFILIVVMGEISLRYFLGLCNAPLYKSSEYYEYIPAPNQTGKRFGNDYHFNSFSQRSLEPEAKKVKILGLGDSVIFGGVQSDQDSIATSIFTNEMARFQMLNISAGSWGPDNCAAYLKEYGTFDAEKMLLVVSSHDAHDTMDFEPVVGIHPSYPKQQYRLAWWELLDRYVSPRIKIYFSKKEKLDPDQKIVQGIHKNGLTFNPGFNELKSIADSLNIPLIVYLHAEKTELHSKKYNNEGNEIIQWANKNKVQLIKELEYNFVESDYRDVIHLSDQGQRKLAEVMIETFQKTR